MTHIIVIGAGQAGASLTARLRDRGFDGQVTLIGGEPVPPYQRPPLSKAYLLGEMTRDRLFLRSDDWYADQGITLMLGQRAEALDLRARTLRVGGETLHYDRLALTTGLEARRLPAEAGGALGGVYGVRTLADVDAMAAPLRQARQAVIVGGGYIGLEAAAVARKLGVTVTVIEGGARILGRVAAPETSAWFAALHRRHGVEVLEGATLDRLTGGDRVDGALLADGRHIAADIAIVGIGLSPHCAIAENAGLAMEGGIRVDACGRTSDAHVWAAGDCAALSWRGRRMRIESVQNAIEMAERVAGNMLGDAQPYDPHPWFWSDQYDVKLQIAGLHSGHDRVIVRPGDRGGVSHWYYGAGRLLAVDAMNDPRAYMTGKRLIENGLSPDPATVAGGDLKALLKA
ncbi:pyridine nucleotide oxidoreductase family protein [Oceaniovalibus guishaninsula JLT2003]|uniref:Pyridine nucleotide oxidoreductase family protein n=1 Tax=Oceaniovalibus guishaninsula JLT2003 TaxID=1231392 RepID=K2H9J4_9RHOB|nr:FAD-dependent oxidoreductase [Oceaniovalibus guishaninsula]EKE44213.1 pyridine nucleotide oxidoreductase family protein [Oceaniovalibus guishaninsula JLT2003]